MFFKEKSLDFENSKDFAIYVNPNFILYLARQGLQLRQPYFINLNEFLLLEAKPSLAITDDCFEALLLSKKNQCEVYFINNHSNDCLDFSPSYEVELHKAPQKLQKLQKLLTSCMK